MQLLAWTIPMVRRLKTSYVMQSRPSQNSADLGMKSHLGVPPVSRIVNGLSKNLRNVQEHRLLIQKDINDVLEKLMFLSGGRPVAANLAGTKKEE
jgi:hypothetical protein